MTRLSDVRVVITGASRGLGEALARRCTAAGATVALVARNQGAIDALARQLGGTAHRCDLSEPNERERLISDIEGAAGPIGVLVNNAATVCVGAVTHHDPDDLRRLVEVNLLAPMELCRQVLPAMLARGQGHIVNISSLGAVAAFPGLAAYGATKAGLSHFSAGLRADLRGTSLRTTVVDLGPVTTDALTEAQRYEPTARSYRRAYRAHALVNTTPDRAAEHIVRGLQRNARYVRIPRRTALLAATAETPRRAVEAFLTGGHVRPTAPQEADRAAGEPRRG